MIRQRFWIGGYVWEVFAYYGADARHAEEIMWRLYHIGCRGEDLATAFDNLTSGKLDTGMTYSNFSGRQTVMVVAETSSAVEFANSFDHEKGHLCRHVSQAFGLDPYGEDAQYLAGEVAALMYPVAKKFLCGHCRKEVL